MIDKLSELTKQPPSPLATAKAPPPRGRTGGGLLGLRRFERLAVDLPAGLAATATRGKLHTRTLTVERDGLVTNAARLGRLPENTTRCSGRNEKLD
ncbi:hypothetical protein [Cupriavidus respiraculi]|uniref:hypothetical protein n=1 Tax=Cupriavidus respiraculi TaxID=195930 RepID=UPI001CC585B1|nr:hypothetical protein [Cupriavidus respiraculi]